VKKRQTHRCTQCHIDFGKGPPGFNALANHTRDKHGANISTRIKGRLDEAFAEIFGEQKQGAQS
jgi:hypothetical protein